MKKLFFVVVTFALSIATMAQTPAQKETKKAEMKDLQQDVVKKREEKKTIGKDVTHAKFKKALDERKEKRAVKRDIHQDEERLENQGVKHPVAKAKHKIKAEKEEKKAKY